MTFRGYTRFTAERGDEAAARLAGRFAEIAEQVVEHHQGQVIEMRGDEALCVFPSARNALHASLALQQQVAEASGADPSLPLSVGIGLDAGKRSPSWEATEEEPSTWQHDSVRLREVARPSRARE